MSITVDIPKLLADLQSVSDLGYTRHDGPTTQHLFDLCRRSRLALAQQSEEKRAVVRRLGEGLEELGRSLRINA